MANPDIITIDGNNFNVYGPKADADAYFQGKLNRSSWNTAGASARDRALISSTRLLELQRYKGQITDSTTPQPLQWPRSGITDRRGLDVPDTDFPEDILNAYYELAQALIDDPALAETPNQDDNTKRVKAGDVETENFRPVQNTPRFPNQVQEYLKPYVTGALTSIGYASGLIDPCNSSFISGQYDRTKGFA